MPSTVLRDGGTRQTVSGTRKGMIPMPTPATVNIYCHKYADRCVNTLDGLDFIWSLQQHYEVGTLLFSNFTDEETFLKRLHDLSGFTCLENEGTKTKIPI